MTRFNIQWTAKTLTNQMNKGKVNFDNAVQRGLVWDNGKKSLLIHSMLYGYAIPAMYFTRDENGVYDSLDGKQRSNAISGFLNGDYALTTDFPAVTDDDGNTENFSGMTFEQLPEWAQDVQIDNEVISRLDSGLNAYKEFLDSLDSKNDKQLIKTIKARTHFISAVYYCYLAVEAEKSQDEINNTLADFFSGNPSTSDDYNKTVTSGSAKPASVQMRRDVMKALVGEDTNCENGTCGKQDESEEDQAE